MLTLLAAAHFSITYNFFGQRQQRRKSKARPISVDSDSSDKKEVERAVMSWSLPWVCHWSICLYLHRKFLCVLFFSPHVIADQRCGFVTAKHHSSSTPDEGTLIGPGPMTNGRIQRYHLWPLCWNTDIKRRLALKRLWQEQQLASLMFQFYGSGRMFCLYLRSISVCCIFQQKRATWHVKDSQWSHHMCINASSDAPFSCTYTLKYSHSKAKEQLLTFLDKRLISRIKAIPVHTDTQQSGADLRHSSGKTCLKPQ